MKVSFKKILLCAPERELETATVCDFPYGYFFRFRNQQFDYNYIRLGSDARLLLKVLAHLLKLNFISVIKATLRPRVLLFCLVLDLKKPLLPIFSLEFLRFFTVRKTLPSLVKVLFFRHSGNFSRTGVEFWIDHFGNIHFVFDKFFPLLVVGAVPIGGKSCGICFTSFAMLSFNCVAFTRTSPILPQLAFPLRFCAGTLGLFQKFHALSRTWKNLLTWPISREDSFYFERTVFGLCYENDYVSSVQRNF